MGRSQRGECWLALMCRAPSQQILTCTDARKEEERRIARHFPGNCGSSPKEADSCLFLMGTWSGLVVASEAPCCSQPGSAAWQALSLPRPPASPVLRPLPPQVPWAGDRSGS